MPWKFHLLLQKQHTVTWTAVSFEEERRRKSRGGQRARTVRCLHRQAKKKGREKEGERPPACPLAFIVIPLMILQVGRNQCGLASAVLRSALCSSVQELWASLLPAAHRFSCDPEHVPPPQEVDKFYPHFSNFAQKNQPDSSTQSQSCSASSFPNLISHLRHNGKIRPLWAGIF